MPQVMRNTLERSCYHSVCIHLIVNYDSSPMTLVYVYSLYSLNGCILDFHWNSLLLNSLNSWINLMNLRVNNLRDICWNSLRNYSNETSNITLSLIMTLANSLLLNSLIWNIYSRRLNLRPLITDINHSINRNSCNNLNILLCNDITISCFIILFFIFIHSNLLNMRLS